MTVIPGFEIFDLFVDVTDRVHCIFYAETEKQEQYHCDENTYCRKNCSDRADNSKSIFI